MGETCSNDLLFPIFPKDILINILVRLPVISLLQYKSVCKSWYSLIQSSHFINLHVITSKFDSFVLQVLEDPNDHDAESPTKLLMLSSELRYGEGGFDIYDLSCFKDLVPITKTLWMVGSCNGLICLHDSELKDVILFNPATRQFRVLPKSITIEEKGIGQFVEDFVALGFDVKTKDYKVLQINFFNGSFLSNAWNCRVRVYSLNTDSWRLLEGIKSLPIQPMHTILRYNHGVYLNGSYFFVGRIFKELSLDGILRNNGLMMSFDFTKEIFKSMQFPEHDNRDKLFLSYLGDKIALFTLRQSKIPIPTDDDYYEIWVLNEDGSNNKSSSVNKELWTKLHSFQIRYMPYAQPKCILNHGKVVLISNTITDDSFFCKLKLFDLDTKDAGKGVIHGQYVLMADIYKQTLVSVLGGNGAATGDGVIGATM